MGSQLIEIWNKLSAEDKLAIFSEVGELAGLPATAIEKDWWVTLTLSMVFSTDFAEHLVFKGGTSLSKGWDLIERFSEDIDLAIDREFLGYNGELSKTQVKKLRKTSCSFITHDFAKSLSIKIEEFGVRDSTLAVQEFKGSDIDPVVIELHYNSITNDADYLQPRVLIEVGARSLMEPVEKRPIQSIVGETFSTQGFADSIQMIPIVLPKRTFLEKAFLLHEEFQRPREKMNSKRKSRHLYDLEKMMDTEHGKEALNDIELYNSIVKHRKKFAHLSGVDYASHSPGKIDFIPPDEVIAEWKADYKTMQESMIYGDSLTFERLIDRLVGLKDRFRKILI